MGDTFLMDSHDLDSASLLQAVRSSLLPGILKTMGSNKDAPRPLKVSSHYPLS